MTTIRSQEDKRFSSSRLRTIGFIVAYCILVTAYFKTQGGIDGRRRERR